MTKTRSTKRALLLSALSLLLCVSMLVGSTFAWFTDSVSSDRNVIQSGNLDVKLEYRVLENGAWSSWAEVDDNTDVFGYSLWEPGYVALAQFRVSNEGSLALKYQLAADVYAETAGVNRDGDSFLLSKYLKTAVVDADATREEILALAGSSLGTSFGMSQGNLEAKGSANASKELAMAIWMPTTVGNDANHNGTDVPRLEFGINLIATQDTVEIDAFGDDYDAEAAYPRIDLPDLMTASAPVDDTTSLYDLPLMNEDNSPRGSVEVPKDAVADDAESLEFIIKKLPVTDATVPVAQGETAVTIDITATGIKEGNTAPIEITLNIGAGLGTPRLYHKNVEIDYISYSNNSGVLIFETTSFSPFTFVYDSKAPAYSDTDVPQATVTEITEEFADADWEALWKEGTYLDPIGTQKLDSVYKFVAPHTSSTVKDCSYKDWECDYYVMLKSNTLETLPEGYIALGGHYGSFNWNGFFNPEVDTNVEIPLLGSVTQLAWTYESVAGLVGEFMCGVGVNTEKAGTTLNGSQFVVMLRLTNPETREYINVATVTYDFESGNSTINYSTALQPAK